jgi:hypothetical protein
MKKILDQSDWAGALARYRGAYAQLWLMQVSLGRLLIRLSMPNVDESLYISALGSEHIVSPFSWENASIVIEEFDTKTRVFDQAAGFELICGGVGLGLVTSDEPMLELWGGEDIH